MDYANFFEGLFNLGPAALLAVLVLAVSYMIRLSRFSNAWIPWAVAFVAPIAFQFIYNPAALAAKWQYPRFIVAIYGFIIAVVVWAIHEFLLSKVENWLAEKGLFPKALQTQNQNNNTP